MAALDLSFRSAVSKALLSSRLQAWRVCRMLCLCSQIMVAMTQALGFDN